MADSSANIPGHSPGARIHVGDGTFNLTRQCLVSRFGAAYMVRVGAAEYSQWSLVKDVCSKDTWDTAKRRPSASAPRRMRWMVGVRCPAMTLSCSRVRTVLTGRPTASAANAARTRWALGAAFEPKPPPRDGR